MTQIDETHDPKLPCAVASAAGSEFPIQNLPFGVFRRAGSSDVFRGGVAIGDQIVDLSAALRQGWFNDTEGQAAEAATDSSLNRLSALGRPAWTALRRALSRNLQNMHRLSEVLFPQSKAELGMPMKIGDYTDFYASIEHATNVGRIFRPQQPLLPNYTQIPIGYHGRSSSIRLSGVPCVRPIGQFLEPSQSVPAFRPTQQLDFELELGFFMGPGNALGHPVKLDDSEEHIFGVCLLNDWSARDIQRWEYQPLGPFLGKNFHTSISPWVVTLDALAPFLSPMRRRETSEPRPLPYLISDKNEKNGALDINLTVSLRTRGMASTNDTPHLIGGVNSKSLFWTVFQMHAHHTSGGCNLTPGDLFGSGTISTDDPLNCGSLLELTVNGTKPLTLPNGETRRFIEDGDEITMTGYCERDGFQNIGLGVCSAAVCASPQ